MTMPVQMMGGRASETFDISLATYDSVSLLVSGQDTGIEGVFLSVDGAHMYVTGDANNSIYQYALSTPWDLSTASYTSKSLNTAAQDTLIQGIFISADGINLFLCGAANDTIYQYALATPWDLSTGSYTGKSKLISAQDTTPQGIFFRTNGLKMYMIGSNSDTVYQYTLATAWDISTATYDTVSFSIAAQQTSPQGGIYFSPFGSIMVIIGQAPNSAFQYELATPWDLSTASYTGLTKAVGAQDSQMSGLFIGKNGSKMFTCGDANNRVYQYSL
jgi:hypothetical protein